MKIPYVFLLVLSGGVLAGTAGFFAYSKGSPTTVEPPASVTFATADPVAVNDAPLELAAENRVNSLPLPYRLPTVNKAPPYRPKRWSNSISFAQVQPPRHSAEAAESFNDSPPRPAQTETGGLTARPDMPPLAMASVIKSKDRLPESTGEQKSPPATTFAFGAGIDHLPRWQGSAKYENRGIPYIDINWRDQVEFSTVKGLIIDVLHGERWHGGFIGTLVWGRSSKDLAGLDVPTLRNTLQGGLFLEYAMTPEATLGIRWRHDLQNTGVAYGEIYGELDLPKIGYLEHDLRLSLEAMNGAGMQRFFGLSAENAARLGVAGYTPGAGLSRTTLSYEGFLPTSEATGIAFSAMLGRLSSNAANSPLVRNFGSSTQKEAVAAFVYHF